MTVILELSVLGAYSSTRAKRGKRGESTLVCEPFPSLLLGHVPCPIREKRGSPGLTKSGPRQDGPRTLSGLSPELVVRRFALGLADIG
jgi:hypothetical protein